MAGYIRTGWPGGLAIAAAIIMSLVPVRPAAAAEAIAWQSWNPAIFAKARADHKLVLLDLEAVWCHWCHVMDAKTYGDPAVIALVGAHYLAMRVDQDSHPALSRRYERWGWPATIVFDGEGRELWKYRGYIEAAAFRTTLEGLVAAPVPEAGRVQPAPAPEQAARGLDPVVRASLERRFAFAYDGVLGGWGFADKYIQGDALDYALMLGAEGEGVASRMVRQTLDAGVKLIDPVWGGLYQYAVTDWDHPHYEKIAPIQAVGMRAYAQAAMVYDQPAWTDAARHIAGFVMTRLSDPSGGFYASQDADASATLDGARFYALDDAARRAGAQPPIDRHLYAANAGLLASGLLAVARATGESAFVDRARRAIAWAADHRRSADGSYRHGERPGDGPFLIDSLAMATAQFDLYRATGARAALASAAITADAMLTLFGAAGSGLTDEATQRADHGAMATAYRHPDDNVAAARLLNQLAFATGDRRYDAAARRIFAWATVQPEASRGALWPGLLVAARELEAPPVHLVVVGTAADPAAQALYRAGQKLPMPYLLVERWTPGTSRLASLDQDLPVLDRAAAFACTATTCSLPVTDPAGLSRAVAQLVAPAGE